MYMEKNYFSITNMQIGLKILRQEVKTDSV